MDTSKLLPEGRYHGTIVKQDLYSTKGEEGGTPYFGFRCLLVAQDNNIGKRVNLEVPVTRSFNLWLNSPENIKRTSNSLRFLGFEDEDISKLNPWHEEHFSLVGKEVSLDISHGENQQGQPQENIWLSMAKKPLTIDACKAVMNKVEELFACYQKDAAEKKAALKGKEPEPGPEPEKEKEVITPDQVDEAPPF